MAQVHDTKFLNAVDALIRKRGSDKLVAEALESATGRPVGTHVVRDWRRRASVPLSWWSSLYRIGFTSDELLTAHEACHATPGEG